VVDLESDAMIPMNFAFTCPFISVVEIAGPMFELTVFKDQVALGDHGAYTLDITLGDTFASTTRMVSMDININLANMLPDFATPLAASYPVTVDLNVDNTGLIGTFTPPIVIDYEADTIAPLVFSAMPSFVTVTEIAGPQLQMTIFKD